VSKTRATQASRRLGAGRRRAGRQLAGQFRRRWGWNSDGGAGPGGVTLWAWAAGPTVRSESGAPSGGSGVGAETREGAGGGGGLYGGGGGAGVLDGNVGGGGSSLVPAGGALSLAELTTPPSVTILPRTGNRPVDPSCVRKTVTSFIQLFGSVPAAARALGLTVQQVENLLTACSTGSH
jgi:hypothetical protein